MLSQSSPPSHWSGGPGSTTKPASLAIAAQSRPWVVPPLRYLAVWDGYAAMVVGTSDVPTATMSVMSSRPPKPTTRAGWIATPSSASRITETPRAAECHRLCDPQLHQHRRRSQVTDPELIEVPSIHDLIWRVQVYSIRLPGRVAIARYR